MGLELFMFSFSLVLDQKYKRYTRLFNTHGLSHYQSTSYQEKLDMVGSP